MTIKRACVALAMAVVFGQPEGLAQETDRWRFRQIQVENDLFSIPFSRYGDRFYTNGLRVSLGREGHEAGADIARLPLWLRPVRKRCAGCVIYPNLSFGQQIYTPEDIEDPDPQPGERPWAAWLFAGFGAAIDTSARTRHDIEVQVGVTGDAALGKAGQEFWHALTDSPEPRGWENQFGPELGINGYYNFQHILREAPNDSVIDWDFVPNIRAAVGTMATYVGGGATFRIGRNISDFPYSPIRPSERAVSVEVLPNLEIYGFMGTDLRVIAHNYFLEGSLFDDEPLTVPRKRYVWDFSFGVTARFNRFNVTYALVRRSEEFVRTAGLDRGIHSFGSLSLTVGLR